MGKAREETLRGKKPALRIRKVRLAVIAQAPNQASLPAVEILAGEAQIASAYSENTDFYHEVDKEKPNISDKASCHS